MANYMVLVGEHMAGKDTLSDYVKSRYGIPSIRFSSVISEIGLALSLVTQEELQDPRRMKPAQQRLGNYFRSVHGEEFYTGALARKVMGKNYTINGLRHVKESNALINMLNGGLVLVGIEAAFDVRFERALGDGIVSSREDFLKLCANPAEAFIQDLYQRG